MRHGEAVAVGMAVDLVYSMKMGHLPITQCERVLDLMVTLWPSLWVEELLSRGAGETPAVLEGLQEFREHLGGDLHVTLLREIGSAFEVTEMDEEIVMESILWLQSRFASVPAGLPQSVESL